MSRTEELVAVSTVEEMVKELEEADDRAEGVDVVEHEVLLEDIGMYRSPQAARYNESGCIWNRRNKSRLRIGQMRVSDGLVESSSAIPRAMTARSRSLIVVAASL